MSLMLRIDCETSDIVTNNFPTLEPGNTNQNQSSSTTPQHSPGVDKIKKVVFLLYKPLFLNIKCEKSADNDNKSANIAFRGPKFCIGPLRLFPEEVGEKGKDENLPISITSLYVFQCR